MSALIRWQPTWGAFGGQVLMLGWSEAWSEAFSIGSGTLAIAGHSTLLNNEGASVITLVYLSPKALGSVTLEAVGHQSLTVAGISYPTEFVPAISGTLTPFGHTTVAGALDFEEPLFLDPPLLLAATGHLGVSGTLQMLISKSIGTGALAVSGRAGFVPLSFGYASAIVKQLFAVTLPVTGRTQISGAIDSSTVKAMGSGTMALAGHAAINQSGFQVEAPPPYTHPVGTGMLALVGAINTTGDPLWTDFPPTDIGPATLDVIGRLSMTADRLFAGGILLLPVMTLDLSGRTRVRSNLSLPGAERVETEIEAAYEGFEFQETFAIYEGEDVSAT